MADPLQRPTETTGPGWASHWTCWWRLTRCLESLEQNSFHLMFFVYSKKQHIYIYTLYDVFFCIFYIVHFLDPTTKSQPTHPVSLRNFCCSIPRSLCTTRQAPARLCSEWWPWSDPPGPWCCFGWWPENSRWTKQRFVGRGQNGKTTSGWNHKNIKKKTVWENKFQL